MMGMIMKAGHHSRLSHSGISLSKIQSQMSLRCIAAVQAGFDIIVCIISGRRPVITPLPPILGSPTLNTSALIPTTVLAVTTLVHSMFRY